ncbi:MAG: RraA family protein [Betaproteobacteria bacterium]|nr:RraA family protein [Betaproteobacteria bacterium]
MAQTDSRLVSQLLAVSTPNVSDALDRLGIEGAPQGILPIYPCAKIAGPAATLKVVPFGQAEESIVLGTLRAIVKGGAGSVLVVDGSENPHINSFGGVAGATAKHNGLVGCVSDAVVRDVDEYKVYGMPVYCKGIAQQSVRGRSACAGYGMEIRLGGVRVRPGDYILADDNGTVVIPHERVAEVITFAQKVRATEERVIAEIRAGADPVEAHQRVNYDNMLKANG